jgi:hypothetical protein
MEKDKIETLKLRAKEKKTKKMKKRKKPKI